MGEQTNGAGAGRRRGAAHALTGAVFVALALFVGATMVAACGSTAKSGADGRTSATAYTEANNNDTVAAKVGDQIVVTLKDNPSTGYSWKMKLGPGLARVSSKFTAPSTSPQLVGASGKRTWVIKVEEVGALKLTGVYMRAWENVTKNAASFSLTINAK